MNRLRRLFRLRNLRTWEISDLGYWSEPYCLYGDGKEVISYSVPLILSDGTVYGVLGIDLTLDYLKSLIPYSEIGEKNQGAYLLGIEKNVMESSQMF